MSNFQIHIPAITAKLRTRPPKSVNVETPICRTCVYARAQQAHSRVQFVLDNFYLTAEAALKAQRILDEIYTALQALQDPDAKVYRLTPKEENQL